MLKMIVQKLYKKTGLAFDPAQDSITTPHVFAGHGKSHVRFGHANCEFDEYRIFVPKRALLSD